MIQAKFVQNVYDEVSMNDTNVLFCISLYKMKDVSKTRYVDSLPKCNCSKLMMIYYFLTRLN